MIKKSKVLVFPAGSEIGLEIYRALRYSHHVEVFGASGKSDHASFVYDNEHYVEDENLYVDRIDFVDRFNRILIHFGIEFVYPTHDTIANFLAENQTKLAATIITSPARTNRIARYKRQTYQHFAKCDFCPALHFAPFDALEFPVFLKPDDGQGGKGACVARDRSELDFHLSRQPELLVTEFLPGEELSVDCFTDFKGKLLFIGPRTRERVQMGISFRSTAVALDDEVTRIANSINNAVELNGAWFFQIKRDRAGRYKLLEFAPRQSSTMGLYRHAGVNFALLSFFNAQRIPVQVVRNDYRLQLDRCLHNRYRADLTYHRVYVDFDETVIADGKVHEQVMAYLYQCRNRQIELVLLTKHRYELDETLESHGIARSLFADVIHLTENQEKWQYINPQGAIFIDNYWVDRRIVSEKLGIPVFDVDAVECLLR